MNTRLRRPGSPWRLLAHQWDGHPSPHYGTAHHITNHQTFGRPTTGNHADTDQCKTIELPGTEFDELVVGRWLHIEAQDNNTWWMNIGGVTIHITANRDGHPTHVRVDGPDDYDQPVAGCTYTLTWTDPDPSGAPR